MKGEGVRGRKDPFALSVGCEASRVEGSAAWECFDSVAHATRSARTDFGSVVLFQLTPSPLVPNPSPLKRQIPAVDHELGSGNVRRFVGG
jgi:hypothetical protein